MKEYKVYLIIESGEPEDESYDEEVDETILLETFTDFETAINFKERLADLATKQKA